MKKALVIILFFAIGSVQAATISWTLADVILEDGQTLVGGFDYDSDTNTYSNISIFSSGTSTFIATEFAQKATPTVCGTSDTGCFFTKAGATSDDSFKPECIWQRRTYQCRWHNRLVDWRQ